MTKTVSQRIAEEAAAGRLNTTRAPTLPAIPEPKKDLDSLFDAVKAIKVWVDAREARGKTSAMDKLVSMRDLYEAGLTAIQGSTLPATPAVSPAPAPSSGVGYEDPRPVLYTPPTPTDLVAHGAFKNIIMTWEMTEYQNHSHVEIWRHTANNLSLATQIGQTTADVYADATGVLGTTYYYWIRAVGVHPETGATITGAYNAGTAGGTSATLNQIVTGDVTPLAIDTALIADAAIVEAKIANLAVTDAKIANATITNAKIVSLDAAKITTGTLAAGRIGAGTIDTTKLTVADTTSLVDNGGFEAGDTRWDKEGGWTIWPDSAAARRGSYYAFINAPGVAVALRNQLAVTCTPGEQFYADAYIMRTGGTVNGYVRLSGRNAAGVEIYTEPGNIITATSYTISQVTGTIPANVVTVRAEVVANTGSGELRVDDVRMFRRASSVVIEDGAIIAAKISVTSLDSVSATIGLLRTATSGARQEVASNYTKVYDASNVKRLQFGDLSA